MSYSRAKQLQHLLNFLTVHQRYVSLELSSYLVAIVLAVVVGVHAAAVIVLQAERGLRTRERNMKRYKMFLRRLRNWGGLVVTVSLPLYTARPEFKSRPGASPQCGLV